SRLVPLNAARLVNTVVPQTIVHHQRLTKHGVNKAHSSKRRPLNLRPSPPASNFHQKVTTAKASQVNAVQGTFMPSKPDLVFHDAPTVNETVPTAFNVESSTNKPNKDLSQSNRNHTLRGNHQHYARMTHPNPKRHVVPTVVLTRSRLVPLNAARLVNTVVPQTIVHHQRLTKHGVNKAHSSKRRPLNLRPSPPASNFHQKVTTAKASQVNAVQGVKETGFGNQNVMS
nr:hypothetical protein [Tanacetum cinerariifolium]